MARAAEAMLRALGGIEVRVLIPRQMSGSGCGVELGLAQETPEEVPVAPVVVRDLGECKFELLFPASVLQAKSASRMGREPDAFLRNALGIEFRGRVVRVTGIAAERFAGAEYLFRVSATE
jgi:hypothetical protein